MPKAKTRIKPRAASRRPSRKSRNKVALKGTVRSSKRVKSELKYIPWDTVPVEDLNPLLQRHFVVGGDIMVARVLMNLDEFITRE